MLDDPSFYLFAVPAVLIYGISKGGFGGSIAVLAVLLMTFVTTPTRAAAILLPILCVMDVFVVWTYRGVYESTSLRILLPGALIGILAGYLAVDTMNDDAMRIMIGALSVAFCMQSWLDWPRGAGRRHNAISGTALGIASGFTSFSIHAGGPPFGMYMLPKRLEPLLYAGTAGIFFAVVNYVKLVPYYLLDQLRLDNLVVSVVLMPLAPIGVKLGHYLVKKSNTRLFYGICYSFLMVVGLKLLFEGFGYL
ncbi:MAG: sulfite exporter TauE/SafE family protein [Proteobacteria bacterium]|nr:MAG: sulfite exporter TauE/SafE family protein [Pseudomonadota bacterium]